MRVFIDACVDPRVAEAFPGHEVTTALDRGWHRLKDHELVPVLRNRFDAPVTIDRGFEFEQNLKKPTFGVIILRVAKTRWSCIGRFSAKCGALSLNRSPDRRCTSTAFLPDKRPSEWIRATRSRSMPRAQFRRGLAGACYVPARCEQIRWRTTAISVRARTAGCRSFSISTSSHRQVEIWARGNARIRRSNLRRWFGYRNRSA